MAFEEFHAWTKQRKIESTAAELHVYPAPVKQLACLSENHPRHSQPEFTAKGLRELKTGIAELSAKGHNATVLAYHVC